MWCVSSPQHGFDQYSVSGEKKTFFAVPRVLIRGSSKAVISLIAALSATYSVLSIWYFPYLSLTGRCAQASDLVDIIVEKLEYYRQLFYFGSDVIQTVLIDSESGFA
jgi:hypothetical protein